MKLHVILAGSVMAVTLAAAQPAEAKKGFKNLKVLADNGKDLKKGMKNMTKGLGVKCKACHIKGKWAKDDVATKKDSRKFFNAVVGTNDEKVRAKALKKLLAALEIDAPKDEARLWKGISMLQKK